MANRAKTSQLGMKLVNLIKNTDSFGTPVSLTYKKDTTIKSFVGGFFTCLARLGVAIYLLVQCLAVINRENVLQTTILKRDLSIDTTENVYNLDNFDFGLRVEYNYQETQPDVQENLDQYVYWAIYQNTYTWTSDSAGNQVVKKQKSQVNLSSCTLGRLGLISNGNDYLGLKQGYQCPENINFKMQGSFASEQTKFFQIRVSYCNQTYLNIKHNNAKQCKDISQQMKVAADLKLYFVVQNSYFDTQDFSQDPIKKYLKPYYLTTKNYTSMYYYMLLSQNEAQYNDGMLFGTATTKTFVETRVDYQVTQEIPAADGSPNAFVSIYVQMDDTHKIVTRKVTTFVNALQATGGFMTVIFVLTTLIVNRFSKTIYHTSLIKSLYKYQKPTKSKGEDINESENLDQDNDQANMANFEKVSSKTGMKFKDRFKDEKEKIFNRLLQQIQNRQKLMVTLSFKIFIRLKALCCKKLTKRQMFHELLYKKGVLKIEKELDIKHISKQLKTLKFIAQVMLTKYQRFMISQFKENLLNHKSIQDKVHKKDHDKELTKQLFKMILNCNTNKMDARMIKNIDLSEDDKLIYQLTEKFSKPANNTSLSNRSKDKPPSGRRLKSRKEEDGIVSSNKHQRQISDFNTIDDLILKKAKKNNFIVDDDYGGVDLRPIKTTQETQGNEDKKSRLNT